MINDYTIAFINIGGASVKPGQIYSILRKNELVDHTTWPMKKKKNLMQRGFRDPLCCSFRKLFPYIPVTAVVDTLCLGPGDYGDSVASCAREGGAMHVYWVAWMVGYALQFVCVSR